MHKASLTQRTTTTKASIMTKGKDDTVTGLLSSIATLREILKVDSPSILAGSGSFSSLPGTSSTDNVAEASIAANTSTNTSSSHNESWHVTHGVVQQQQVFDDTQHYKDEIGKKKLQIQDYKAKLEQLQKEFEKEKSMRKSLETTHEALFNHKRELNMQLELVTKSRESSEEKATHANFLLQEERASHSKEKLLLEGQLREALTQKQLALKKADGLEARLESSQRVVEELTNKLKQNNDELASVEASLEEINKTCHKSDNVVISEDQAVQIGENEKNSTEEKETEVPEAENNTDENAVTESQRSQVEQISPKKRTLDEVTPSDDKQDSSDEPDAATESVEEGNEEAEETEPDAKRTRN